MKLDHSLAAPVVSTGVRPPRQGETIRLLWGQATRVSALTADMKQPQTRPVVQLAMRSDKGGATIINVPYDLVKPLADALAAAVATGAFHPGIPSKTSEI